MNLQQKLKWIYCMGFFSWLKSNEKRDNQYKENKRGPFDVEQQ